MQGANNQHFYFFKTELSTMPFTGDKVLKNCLVRFPKKLKDKYWGTVHQMLEMTGYYQIDTVKVKKAIEKFWGKYKDEFRKE